MQVLFVCQFGGAKSVLAAEYFNRLARDHGLPHVAKAVAAEEPYAAVLEPVAELLERDGIDVHAFQPRRIEEADVQHAARVISIDCDVPHVDSERSERWDDVPKVSEDLHGSAAAIRRHVDALIEELRG